MSADQPDDPTTIDRPPNAADRTTADRRVPVTGMEDAGPTATVGLAPRLSIPVRQAALQETRIAVLRSRVAALENALEAERDRRRAIVNRYERALAERERTERDAIDDPSLADRLRELFSP
jgi:hypothetical protein